MRTADIQSIESVRDLLKTKFAPSAPKVLAVSKLQSSEKILELYHKEQKSFAENYVQEALPKLELLKHYHIDWHFIGSLQKNKVKFIVGHFHYIHSVDSWELAEKIDKIAGEKKIKQNIFVQINLAQESTKSGISPQQAEEQILKMSRLKHVEIVGLMTMPPLFENPEMTRPYFKQLKELQIKLQKIIPSLVELSMGTSSDYLIAAEEGATWVRLGTVLFGERKRGEPVESL